MKKLFTLLFVVYLAALPCPAIIKQVTNVGAAASTIVTPGINVHTIVIQNNGTGNVRITIDGGSVTGLSNPTATTGYRLAAGAMIILTYNGDKRPPIIRAILETGTTTTLDIVTDDSSST
jgi:hypothetical protein